MTQEAASAPTAPSTPATTESAPAADAAPAPGLSEGAPPASVSTAVSIQEAKLEALRLRNAERKARVADANERAKALEAREAAVRGWNENPLEGLRALGVEPKVALDALVREAERDGTPAGEIAAMRREMAAELAKRDAELAALREAEAARKAEAEARQAEARQAEASASFLAQPALAALRGRWSDTELVQLGNHYADQLSAGGRHVTMQQIAEAVVAECQKWASRFAPAPEVQPTAPAAPRTTNGGRPSTLTTKGLESAPKRALTFHEAVALAKRRG